MNALIVVVISMLSISAVCGHYYDQYRGNFGGHGATLSGGRTGHYSVNGPSFGPSKINGPNYGPAQINGASYGHASLAGPRVAVANVAGAVNGGAEISAPIFGGVRRIGGVGFADGIGEAWKSHGQGYY